jgi:hypothetical protein
VTIVLSWLGRVEHKIRRVRRIVHYTVRARPGTVFDDLRDTLVAEGLRVVSCEMYDHREDRTFEVRLSGPAIQFGAIADKLRQRGDVIDVETGG